MHRGAGYEKRAICDLHSSEPPLEIMGKLLSARSMLLIYLPN